MLERLPYFKLHPADYLLDTLDLTHAEHGIYCLLMFTYYWQGALPSERTQLYRLARANDADSQGTVERILKRFFHEADGKLLHHRIERELLGLVEFMQHQSAAGKASALARQKKPRRLRGNGETEPFALPEWIPPDAWEAWLKVRKRKRASNEPHALNLAVKTLDELRAAGNAPRAVLERSTLSGYTGLFEVPKPRPQRKEPDFPI